MFKLTTFNILCPLIAAEETALNRHTESQTGCFPPQLIHAQLYPAASLGASQDMCVGICVFQKLSAVLGAVRVKGPIMHLALVQNKANG